MVFANNPSIYCYSNASESSYKKICLSLGPISIRSGNCHRVVSGDPVETFNEYGLR
jgi:hypothetical protein